MKTQFSSENALKLMKQKKSILVYDLETTGLNKTDDRIIQFSGDLYSCEETGKYHKVDSLNIYIRQEFLLPAKIVELTGITDEKLQAEGISEREAAEKILCILKKSDVICGYNSKRFDNLFMENLMARQFDTHFTFSEQIDVFEIVKELIDLDDLPDRHYKLCVVADYYKVAVEGFHNAAVDIENTWLVLKAAMYDYRNQKKEHKQEIKQYIRDFKITGMSRWKKSRTMDRLYIKTSRGEVIYDLYKNEVSPKQPNGPNLDPGVLIDQMNVYAKSCGYSSYKVYNRY